VKASTIFVGILLFGPRMTAERVFVGLFTWIGGLCFGLILGGLVYGLLEYSDDIVDTVIGVWQKKWKFFAVSGTLIALMLLLGMSRSR